MNDLCRPLLGVIKHFLTVIGVDGTNDKNQISGLTETLKRGMNLLKNKDVYFYLRSFAIFKTSVELLRS